MEDIKESYEAITISVSRIYSMNLVALHNSFDAWKNKIIFFFV